jgi:hypothetical protein
MYCFPKVFSGRAASFCISTVDVLMRGLVLSSRLPVSLFSILSRRDFNTKGVAVSSPTAATNSNRIYLITESTLLCGVCNRFCGIKERFDCIHERKI